MAGVFADITERKKTEEALRNSEAKYRFLTEYASDLIWTLDLNLQTTFVTQSVKRVLGFTPEERMLQRVEDQLTPESLESARQRLFEELTIEREQGIQEGKPVLVELDYYHKNGSIVCLQTAVTFIRDEKGTPIGLHGISRDITELKRVQKALRESEERYRQITENSLTGIFVYQDGRAVYANRRLADIVGYSPEEILGIHFLDAVYPDERHMVKQMAKARLSGEIAPNHYELRLLHKDGHTVWSEVLSHIIEYQGRPAILGNVADVTESRMLRQQLLQAQKMEAIGTLAGGIAHDFNNLLTIINGFSEMILLETGKDDPRYRDLKKILETGRKGADMVQRLLSFTKKAPTKLEPLDLNHRIEESKKLMDRSFPKTIEIKTNLPDNLGMVNADAGQMDQLIMNLCVNAKDAMTDGGRIEIETRNTIVDKEYCRLNPDAKPGSHVLIEISDTGAGMSKETMDRIFDPFFTTKGWDFKKGTGLGLSVAKGIVEQHDGWITCESEPGKGTTFRIYFPAIEASPVDKKPESPAETTPGAEKILLVDDEEYVRDLGKRILERAGYEVITASNGREALDIYVREQSNVGVVVLDLMMPQMSGERCLEELLRINPRLKVVVSTGHALDSTQSLRLTALASGFVNKPYEMRQMVQVVKMVLESGGTAS
jgi:PAS domain S-box-containing protein